jgi:hypothetical protein
MKIRLEMTIELTPDSWARWAGIYEDWVRQDVIAYVTSSVPDLPGICQTDAVVRWHLRPGTRARQPRRVERDWPHERDGD